MSINDVVVGGFFDLEIEIYFFEKSFKIWNCHGEAKTRFSLKGDIDKMRILELGFEI